MRLTAKKYTYKEIKDFQREVENGNKDLKFLLDNVSCLRILGYKLTIPETMKFKVYGFGDVIKFTTSTKILLTKGKMNELR